MIKGLDITVSEFNDRYNEHYSLIEEKGILMEGFWTISDSNNKECAMFFYEKEEHELRGNYLQRSKV